MPEHAESQKGKGRPKGFDRDEALRIALRLFWEKGYGPTSVAELCQAMDINPPSLYCCFGNKASLFLEAVGYYEKTYWEEPARAFFSETNIFKAIDGYFDAAARILLSPHTPCGCMVALAAVNICPHEREVIDAIHAMRMETKKMFSDRLAIAIKDGQIPADSDIPTLAGSLHAFLEGLSLQARDGIFLSQLLNLAACASRILPSKK